IPILPVLLPLKIELTRSRNNIRRSPFSRFRSVCTSAEFFRNVAWWKFSKLLFLHFCASLFFSRYIPPLHLINTKSLTRLQDFHW
ncbi:hypothetical protein GW17_00039935, partial [Ensete ventricosum]